MSRWTEEDLRAFTQRRLAQEQRARERTESEQQRIERELDAMAWIRQDCGRFEDPLTGQHYMASVAYKIAMQRRK